MLSSNTSIDALMVLLLTAIPCYALGDATSSVRHRQTRHVHPTREPTATSEVASAEPGEYVLDADNDVWIAAASSPPIAATTSTPPIYDTVTTDATLIGSTTTDKLDLDGMVSSPPIAAITNAPGMPRENIITTDAAMSGPAIADQLDSDEMVAEGGDQSAVAPIYALRHGRGAFAIAGGTGCYRGARGQAQADFGIQNSRVDLFVPSISWTLADIDDSGMGPQDTTWNRDRRMQEAQECNLLREGADSFNILSLNLERRSNPPASKYMKKSSTSYHEHGEFKAQEQWFEGISGEYSLACVHHDCQLNLFFGIGPSASGLFSTMKKQRNLLNDEHDGESNHQMMTSLNLQGTTELAFQGPGTDLLSCIENCGVGGSTYKEDLIEVDAEYSETINVRNFDNTNSLVQLDSHGKGKGKGGKGEGGEIYHDI